MFENHGKGIGAKGKDNGVLMLLALDDRQVRIETGYGLEGFITDGFAGETSRAMTPFFRDGEYGARPAVEGATRVAQRIADGRTSISISQPCRSRKRGGAAGRIPIGFWVVLFIIIMNTIGRKRRPAQPLDQRRRSVRRRLRRRVWRWRIRRRRIWRRWFRRVRWRPLRRRWRWSQLVTEV